MANQDIAWLWLDAIKSIQIMRFHRKPLRKLLGQRPPNHIWRRDPVAVRINEVDHGSRSRLSINVYDAVEGMPPAKLLCAGKTLFDQLRPVRGV